MGASAVPLAVMFDLLVTGAIAMGFAIAGLFFLRFWHDTRDRLFGWFGAAFWLLASNRLLLAFFYDQHEMRLIPYAVRLLAYATILAAIVDKNLRAASPRGPGERAPSWDAGQAGRGSTGAIV